MPFATVVPRGYRLIIEGAPSFGPFGANKLIGHFEFVAGEIGQVGTQLDGIGHIGVQLHERAGFQGEMRFYNGFTETDIASPHGLIKLGIEKVKPIFTRGILLDIAGLKGKMLEMDQEITPADIQAALARQGMTEADIKPGDAVLFHTGWGSLWMVDNQRHDSGAPGIGLGAAKWLAQKQVVLVGADTWPVEVVPNPDPTLAFPAHNELITKHGILLHENLNLAELAKDKVYQFAYIFVRVPFKGATGSPGSPIAVK
jgi:kynurenine formamidase